MISIINGKYGYNNNVIFNKLNINIKDNTITAIIGNNGSGKTTLSNIISGLYILNKGILKIDNLVINKKTKQLDIRKKVSIVMQNPDNYLIFNKVYDDIEFTLKNMKVQGNYKEIVTKSLKEVGMQDYINSNPYEMSQGQKQRIVIASCLSLNTQYLVFDEITSSLDSKTKKDIYNLMIRLKENKKTIIYTTNIIEELIYADEIILLNENEPIIIEKRDLINKLDVLKEYGFNIPLSLEIIKMFKDKGIKVKLNNEEIINTLKDII